MKLYRSDGTSRIKSRVTVCLFGSLAIAGCGSTYEPLAVVDYVDPASYVGKWYEIARYPNSFERGCVGSTAEYALRDDGRIDVLNTCYESTLDGPERQIQGSARIVDKQTNAKLKVTFFPPFEGDYWIIDLAEDYSYAVVGDPSRRFLWILARDPQIEEATFQGITDWLPMVGYDPERLILVEQPDIAG